MTFYPRPQCAFVTLEQVIAATAQPRRGDAAADTITCPCGGTITYAREERTMQVRAACNRFGCFEIKG
jgi:uncharacterized radical SAM superfamily protein